MTTEIFCQVNNPHSTIFPFYFISISYFRNYFRHAEIIKKQLLLRLGKSFTELFDASFERCNSADFSI